MTDVAYSSQFFDRIRDGALISARELIPVLWQFTQPESVVDVGCGTGAWLREFNSAGVTQYLGIDGDYVDRKKLLIEQARFQAADLEKPLCVDRRFDLAMSLEVAEHLPASCADAFVQSLTQLSSVILFSAAVPYQGGDHHVNEQWPEYWQERFARQGYVVVDCLRRLIWRNRKIEWWYKQNVMFYVEQKRLADYPQLARAFGEASSNPQLSIVHPEYCQTRVGWLSQQLDEADRVILTYSLRLRQLNLAAFPDWRQPDDAVAGQIRGLLSALSTHPDKQRIALVIDAGTTNRAMAFQLLRQVAAEIFSAADVGSGQAPEISMIDDQFTKWQVLCSCMSGRVVLPVEDAQGIASSGAAALRPIALSELQDGRPLAT